MHVTQILPHGGRAPGERTAVLGFVSTRQPAPSSSTDPLFVVIPDRNPNEALRFNHWPMCHGATLPALGASVLVVFDHLHGAWVAGWDGVSSNTTPAAIGALAAADNLSDLQSRTAALTHLGIARGAGTISAAGSVTNTQVTITHGLGVTPVYYAGSPGFEGSCKAVSANNTTFVLQFDLYTAAGSAGSSVTLSNFGSGTWNFSWVAIA